MKITLIVFVLAFRLFATEVSVDQEAKDDLKELHEIQALMAEMHEALRADRHDQTVQLRGKEIEERLDKLGHEADEREKRDEKANKLAERFGDDEKTGKKPAKSSRETNVPALVTFKESAAWRGVDWAKLPQSAHVGILQTYAGDVPVKWRKRIAAYFISVQDDEVRRAEKP